jgi:hypothetical protein
LHSMEIGNQDGRAIAATVAVREDVK